MRSMPELMILVRGMVAATRSVAFVIGFLVMLMFIFAIALTQLSKETETVGEEFYPDVLNSMFSLWIYGTLLDDLASITIAMKEESPVCLAVFTIFLLMSALTAVGFQTTTLR